MKVIHTEKRFLQKIAKVISIICMLTAACCLIFMLINKGELTDVIEASFGALTFFFFMVGIVLHAIGTTDIPNLKVETMPDNESNN
jgi:hypothetical protein